MDSEHISRMRAAMNATTDDFLSEFTPKLGQLFHQDLSMAYLDQMNDHLQTFYNDVLSELETKQNKMAGRIDDLMKEAVDLKRQLNVDLDFDLNRPDDMPLMVYQEKLDSDLKEMREKYQQKLEQIEECLRTQEQLCAELKENLRELSTDPLASDADIFAFENYLLDLRSERARRLNEIESLQMEIHVLAEEMGIELNDSDYRRPEPTKENIRFLETKRDQHKREKENIKHECEQMLQKLEVLWDCLEAPSSSRSIYRNIAAECKVSSVKELSGELKLCKTMKQENMKQFIEKLRSKLVEQWDKIYKSQQERDRLELFRSDTYNEDLLQLHEIELEECTRFYNENKAIFDLFISRNEWWEKKKALEAKQNEPNRYNNRGGQLLKEEKERKLTDIEIPKIEKRIKTLAEEFSRQNNRPFTINGVCIIDLIDKEWESYRSSKELLKSARKAVATPSKVAMTPRTPMRGQVTLKRMASTTNLGMSTGNLAKKRHLEVPTRDLTRTGPVQKMTATASSSSYMIRSHTKRNLFTQYNDDSIAGFAKPAAKSIQSKRPLTSIKKGTLTNISANKIVKKYRLSSSRRKSQHKGIVSDESLVNYDTFENHIKTSHISNSSVVEQREQQDRENVRMFGEAIPLAKTSAKNNIYRSKSPLKPSNLGTLQTTNIIDLV